MTDTGKLESKIRDLELAAGTIGKQRVNYRELWDEVRSIQSEFKAVRFKEQEDREKAWQRFQNVVGTMKASIDKAKADNQNRFEKSEELLRRIERLARSAIPSTGFEDLIFNLATFGMAKVITAAVNALPGPPVDERKMELEGCSTALREGWALHRESKDKMIGQHRSEGWKALKDAQDRLDAAWASWREAKGKMREAKQAAREQRDREHAARQAEFERKQAAFRDRVRTNIAKNEASLDKAEAAEDRTRDNIANLRDRIANARHPDQIARLEGFLQEAEDRLDSIRESIARLRDWIREDRDKL